MPSRPADVARAVSHCHPLWEGQPPGVGGAAQGPRVHKRTLCDDAPRGLQSRDRHLRVSVRAAQVARVGVEPLSNLGRPAGGLPVQSVTDGTFPPILSVFTAKSARYTL